MGLPGIGRQTLKFIAMAASSNSDGRGARSFQASSGRVSVSLKCECQLATSDADSTYSIMVNKTDSAKLGVDLESRNGEPWWIKAVNEGLVAEWNWAHPEFMVQVGHCIVEVNGIR